MKPLIGLVVALAIGTSTAYGQTGAPSFPVAGTVLRVSPAFVPREENRASGNSVVLIQTGTVVRVTGREGPWYTVVLPSPLGDRPGLMDPRDIRLDPEALLSGPDRAAVLSERGVVEIIGYGFPQVAQKDAGHAAGEVLLRQEAFLKPSPWLQVAAGVDLRTSSQPEVAGDWQLDVADRGPLRPKIALRRLSAALTTNHFSLDLGKQFIRWGRSDILSPVDRFAPRDYLVVLDSELLPVIGVRAAVRAGGETFELVWLPQMTPSRVPLVGGRWALAPPVVDDLTVVDNGLVFPDRTVQGLRWSHSGRFDIGLSAFDGFHHLPDVTAVPDPNRGALLLTRSYPRLRSLGAELAVPTSAVTLRAEAAYFTSPTSVSDDYVLYIVEAERQAGEWLLTAGYVGEVVTEERSDTVFQAERGMAGSTVGRAALTIDPRRTLEIEGAARQDGGGVYAKAAYSQVFGGHWRLTLAAAKISGPDGTFFGQYERNSHVSASLRLSY